MPRAPLKAGMLSRDDAGVPARPRFAAIVLAAGLSQRMGGPNKLLLPYRGRALIAWPVAAACASRAQAVVLVTGRDAPTVAAAAGAHDKLRRIENPHAQEGLSTSLKLGLESVAGIDAVAVLLGDMPGIDAALIDRLFAAWRPDTYAIVPTFEGAMGNPAVLCRDAIADCAGLSGDRGARRLIEANAARVVRVPVESGAVLRDFDRPQDFHGAGL